MARFKSDLGRVGLASLGPPVEEFITSQRFVESAEVVEAVLKRLQEGEALKLFYDVAPGLRGFDRAPSRPSWMTATAEFSALHEAGSVDPAECAAEAALIATDPYG